MRGLWAVWILGGSAPMVCVQGGQCLVSSLPVHSLEQISPNCRSSKAREGLKLLSGSGLPTVCVHPLSIYVLLLRLHGGITFFTILSEAMC